MRTRRARPADVPALFRLIECYAAQGLLLPRTEAVLRARLRCFRVLEADGRLAGCVALEEYGPDLAEIRSLAVDPDLRGRRLGSRLVQAALAEARRRKFARVFAVTHAPAFFLRQGFELTTRRALPEKLARDCATCPQSPACKLLAVVATICPERVALPILSATVSSVPPV